MQIRQGICVHVYTANFGGGNGLGMRLDFLGLIKDV